MNNPFYYKNDTLFCEQVSIQEFAKTVQTPFYLYSKAEIEYNCQQVWESAKNVNFQPFYALKANYNPAILKIILAKNFGADIVSGGELLFAQKAGFSPDKISFAGVGKTDEEINNAIQNNIHSINIESEAELLKVAQIAKTHGKVQRIAIRINPDIEAKTHEFISTGLHTNKFGIAADEAFRLYLETNKYKQIKAEGIHVHIGSQITEDSPFLATAKFLVDFIKRLKERNIKIDYLDLGGGVGIDYSNNFQTPEKPRTYVKKILKKYIAAFQNSELTFIAELGRSIVGTAGVLISKVVLLKKSPAKKFVIADAAMNNLIRPSLYGGKHEIVPLINNKRPKEKVDIVGPICESSDFLRKDYDLNAIKAGEFLAVCNCGAYGQSLSSNYNLRPTIAEYLVDGRDVSCIFKGNSVQSIAANYEW